MVENKFIMSTENDPERGEIQYFSASTPLKHESILKIDRITLIEQIYDEMFGLKKRD